MSLIDKPVNNAMQYLYFFLSLKNVNHKTTMMPGEKINCNILVFIGLLFLSATSVFSQTEMTCNATQSNYNFTLDVEWIESVQTKKITFPPSDQSRKVNLSLYTYFFDTLQVKHAGEELGQIKIGPICGESTTMGSESCVKGPAMLKINSLSAGDTQLFNAYALQTQDLLLANGFPTAFNQDTILEDLSDLNYPEQGAAVIQINVPASAECLEYEINMSGVGDFPTLRNYRLECPENTVCPTALILQEDHRLANHCRGRQYSVCGLAENIIWTDPNQDTWENHILRAGIEGTYKVHAQYPGCEPMEKVFEVTDVPMGNQTNIYIHQPDKFLCEGESIILKSSHAIWAALPYPDTKHQWYKNGEPISDATGPNYEVRFTNPTDFSNYMVKAITEEGCTHTTTTLLEKPEDPQITINGGNTCYWDISQNHVVLGTSPKQANLQDTYPDSSPQYTWTHPDGTQTNDGQILLRTEDEGFHGLEIKFENTQCTVDLEYELNFSDMSFVPDVRSSHCDVGGEINVNVVGAIGEVSYELYQRNTSHDWVRVEDHGDGPIFSNLATDQRYRVCVKDSAECQKCQDIDLEKLTYNFEVDVPRACSEDANIHLQLKDPSGAILKEKRLPITSDQLGQTQAVTMDYNGCHFEKEVSIPEKLLAKVYIPDAFSPNGDGQNDVFKIYNTQRPDITIQNFSIYNTFGQQIYDEQNSSIASITGWDGSFKNEPLSAGVYMYTVEYKTEGCPAKYAKGSLTLAK